MPSCRTNGDSLAAKASQPVRDAIAGSVEKGETAMKPVPAAVFRVNEKDRAWVDAMCTPHPSATLTDKITFTGARERSPRGPTSAPRAIRACRSTALRQAQDRQRWRIYELPCGHDAMVDMPDRLTEILLEVA